MRGADLGESSIAFDLHVSGQPREVAVELDPFLEERSPLLEEFGFVTDFTERGHLRTDDALGAPVSFAPDSPDGWRKVPQTAQDGRDRKSHPTDDLGNRLAATDANDRHVGGAIQSMCFGLDVGGCIHAGSL